MKTILKTRKDEIVANVGKDEFKKLQKVKLLKLMEIEIQQLLEFWSLGQVLEILNSELGFKISKTVFYEFCAKNLKKDEKVKPLTLKYDRHNIDINNSDKDKKSIKNIDDLTDSTLDFLSKNLPKKQRIKNGKKEYEHKI